MQNNIIDVNETSLLSQAALKYVVPTDFIFKKLGTSSVSCQE